MLHRFCLLNLAALPRTQKQKNADSMEVVETKLA